MRVRALLSFAVALLVASATALTTAAPAQAYTSRVTLTTGSKTTTAGVKLRVTGKITAPSPRRTVRMQYYTGGIWRTYATATSSTSGWFSLVYPAAYGTHTARVYVSGTRGYRAITSPRWTVRGNKAPTAKVVKPVSATGTCSGGPTRYTYHWKVKMSNGTYRYLTTTSSLATQTSLTYDGVTLRVDAYCWIG